MSESDAHIQDADILRMSKQETGDKGKIRFLATLPSGREIHSEWLDPGQKREAMHKWLDAVRQEIVADETEARMKARRAALESRNPVPSVETPSPTPNQTTGQPSTPAVRGSSSAASVPSLSTDPSLFVRQAVVNAEQTVAYWRAESAKAIANLQAAQTALEKWRAIALNLGVSTSAEDSGSPAAGQSADGMHGAGSAAE